MAKTNVIWASYHQPEVIARGYWDNGLLFDLLPKSDYKHHQSANNEFPRLSDGEGAIVIINGRTHTEDAEKINADIAKLRWCLFIDTGDEEAGFPWRDIKHPVMRVWVMMPRMNQHDDVSFHLPNGYRPETRPLLKKIGYKEKDLDWFFAGQVTHNRRHEMANEIWKLGQVSNGLFVETHSFGEEGMKYADYMDAMVRAKIAFCPSGPESPDNFRLYEALEAGCLPIVDAFSSNHQSPGFWQYLFDGDLPFPVLDYWDKLPALLPELLKDWPANANRAVAWWQLKKREILYKLEDDVKELAK